MQRGRLAGAMIAAAMVVAGCQGSDDDLASAVAGTGLTLHDPALPGVRPRSVEVVDGTVRVTYDEPGLALSIGPAPDGSLCASVEQQAGSECTESDGVMRSDMEEMTDVAVLRGDVVLVVSGLVTEADETLVDDVVGALRSAPEVSSEDLVAQVD